MSLAPAKRADIHRTGAGAVIVRSWRRLTGGRSVPDAQRRTLIACSGGADSSALVLALASASPTLAIGHILHDLRARPEAEADARAVAGLARRLGLPFYQAEVRVRDGPGNAEAKARRARYDALDALARSAECPFVAVGHHAGDQAETVLMGLLRGAGPRGLAGVAPSRRLGHALLVRPMLTVTRDAARGICQEAGWAWCEDLTNSDRTLLRGAVRHGLLPAIELLRPGAFARIARTAALLGDAAAILGERVQELRQRGQAIGGTVQWGREILRKERPAVLGELFRSESRRAGGRGLDRMGSKSLDGLVRAITDERSHPREFSVGGIRVTVSLRIVTVHGGDGRG